MKYVRTIRVGAAAAALCVSGAAVAQNTAFDANVTPGVIFGTGNANGA